MPDLSADQSNPDVSQTSGHARQQRLRALLPHLFTALFAVLISLGIQALLRSPPPQPLQGAAATSPAPTPVPSATASSTPLPSLQTDTQVLNQEIIDLRAEQQSLRSALYLMRAANLLADAESALSSNSIDEVERLLLTARVSLDHAYSISAEQEKGPIGEFRLQVGRLRDDLRLRPEGLDQRLRRLRADMLSLIDA